MEGKLLAVVLTLGCSLGSGADIPVAPDFGVDKMSGIWYPAAMVMDKFEPMHTHPRVLELEALHHGALRVKHFFEKDGVCRMVQYMLGETNTPGVFLSPNQTSTLRFVDVKPTSYYILHVDTGISNVLHLSIKKQKLSGKVKRKFENLAKKLGLPTEKIIYLPITGECAKFEPGSGQSTGYFK